MDVREPESGHRLPPKSSRVGLHVAHGQDRAGQAALAVPQPPGSCVLHPRVAGFLHRQVQRFKVSAMMSR